MSPEHAEALSNALRDAAAELRRTSEKTASRKDTYTLDVEALKRGLYAGHKAR